MGDDSYGLLGEPDYGYSPGFSVDNRLKESTRICPRHGGYCTPDCALAFTNSKETEWVCVEVYKARRGSGDCIRSPRVRWK